MKRFDKKGRAKIYLRAAKIYASVNQRFPSGVSRECFGKNPEDINWKTYYPELYLVNNEDDDVSEMTDDEVINGRVIALLFAHQIALNP